MKETYLGYIFVLLSAAAFASTSVFTKLAYAAGMDGWTFTLVTSAMSLVVLGVIHSFQAKRELPRSAQAWRLLFFFALCGGGAGVSFNLALGYVTISLGTILLFTYPAFVAIGAFFILSQRPSIWHTLALVLTLVGAGMTVNRAELGTGAASWIGIALALFSACSHGTYMVLGERTVGMISAVVATIITRLMMMLLVLLMHPQVIASLALVTAQGWLVCLVGTAVAGVAPFLFLNRGISLIGANRAAIASVAELPFALLLGMVYQADQILPLQWGGAAAITAAVVLSQSGSFSKGETEDGPRPGTA